MISVTCPNCQQSFDIDASLVGRHGRCDHCQTKFELKPDHSSPEPVRNNGEIQEPEASQQSSPPAKPGKAVGLIAATIAIVAGAGIYLQQQQPPETKQSDTAQKPATTPASDALDSTKPQAKSEEGQATPTPATGALPALAETFPVKTQFGAIDIRAYLKTYPNVHQGWMPSKPEQADEAKQWGSHLGPLGVRIRSHAPQMQGRPAFAANVPHCLRAEDGKLALTAAEVVSIAPGSPAENHLQVGDLIIGIEGEDLKSGNQYRPEWQTMHKDARELQLMLGEKIDQAQGRGDIRLTVMRYPEDSVQAFARKLKLSDGRILVDPIAVKAGDTIHLIVDPDGNNAHDHLAWLSPQLTGNGQSTLDLTDTAQITPDQATTGWGEVSRNKDLSGKDLGEKGLAVHAASHVTFTVPTGYTSFQTAIKATHANSDVTAIIKVNTRQQALPVRSKEIWAGKGGNQSVGAQSFDVEVPGDGYISLVSDKFDDNIHGDGTSWFDVTLEGSYGSKELLAMPNEGAHAGYGRPHFTTDKATEHKGVTYQQALNLHAHGVATWRLPKGTTRIKGSFAALSHGKVQPRIEFTNLARPLSGIHKEKLVELRFPIGKAGSFSSTYPKDCAKSELTVRRHTEWLAAQQQQDGSWPRLAGYTTNGWDTSFCALALMSSGDPKYNDQIKRAAYLMAYDSAPSEWTAERAMRVIFLAEYYLKTKDQAILAGLQSSYVQLMATAKTDFMAGHKVNGFGYGIAGQHYGTGHLALGIALASRTPISVDKELVDGILRHAGEVCVNGTYAYGRGRRLARDDSRYHGGGNAMVGPGILGAMIGGGHEASIQEALERWSASAGDGDNSHATSSLAFIFASLAMACGDEDVFLKHMQHFRYKMTLDDNWEGGILKSAFPLDFQGGEGVTATWIRSAGSILVFNALKKNLAITGNQSHYAKQRIKEQAVSEWGGQIHSYYLRNWCLAKEVLGPKAPTEIEAGIAAMEKLPRTTALVPETKTIVTQLAPGLIQTIAKDRSLSEIQRAYAIELLCGLDFRLFASLDGKNQKIDLTINHPLHQLNWLEEDKQAILSKPEFNLQASLEITADNLAKPLTFSASSKKGFNPESGELKTSMKSELKNPGTPKFKGQAKISFQLGDTTIAYTRPLWFNTEFAHSNNINLRRLNLKLKVAPRAYFQSQPLMIAGRAFDCMYPKERMLEVKGPEPGTVNIHEGDSVLVNLASENFICPWVLSMTFPEMTQVRVAKAKNHHASQGSVDGDWENLYDFDDNTGVEIKPSDGKTVIAYDFGKAVTLNGLDVRYQHGNFVRVSYQRNGQWIPLVWDRYSPHTGHNPRFPDTEAQHWKVELQHGRNAKLSTLRFYHNPNRILNSPAYIQSQQPDSFPQASAN
ncbi:NPCBM/NEW2 domain-containing protein [Verrucomicrobiaceae bacterium N1E253]|uniref:NPCBM/NEW2 domain-containing protein n=1 Tax=Oceaniferula marina TaxID=2748318 RepID=A0A851GJH6_9BACT|nr:DUF6288 domain-containing protein [Oceaniferula marina]NWK57486.1 NPCBM/NEW2 domain-containing protein [Oceaniferula marina]